MASQPIAPVYVRVYMYAAKSPVAAVVVIIINTSESPMLCNSSERVDCLSRLRARRLLCVFLFFVCQEREIKLHHSAFIYVDELCTNMQRCRAENHRNCKDDEQRAKKKGGVYRDAFPFPALERERKKKF